MKGVRHAPAPHLHTASSLMVLLLALSSAAVPQSQQQKDREITQQLLDELQAEVEELKQTVALLHGGAAPVPGLPNLRAQVGQPFIPQATNTQRTIATQASLWPQYWAFQSAVIAEDKVTATHVMTDRPAGAGGPWCIVLGDGAGRLYFFTPQGHLVFEHDTGNDAVVTSLASALTRSDTTLLAVGLQDASIQLLALHHQNLRAPDGSGIKSATILIRSTAADRAAQDNSTTPAVDNRPIQHLLFTKSPQRKVLISVDTSGQVVLLAQSAGRVLMTRQLATSPLAVNLNNDFQMIVQTPLAAMVVLMHRGRSKVVRPCSGLAQSAAHAPAATDADGAVKAAGTASSRSDSSGNSSDCKSQQDGACSWGSGGVDNDTSTPSSTNSGGSSSSVTSKGASDNVEDLKAPAAEAAAAAAAAVDQSGHQVIAAGAAAGHDVLVSAVFDPVKSHRVFGVTAGGDLLVLVVPSAQRTNLCKVAQRVSLGLPPGPVRLIATHGRLVILHTAGLAAFDTSSSVLRLGAAHMASHTWENMWRLYGLPWQQQPRQQQAAESHQQQEQTGGVTAESSTATTMIGNSGVGALHSAAAIDGSTAVLAAAAAANLLLLPLGDYGIATFSDLAGPGLRVSGGQNAAAGYSSGGSEAPTVDWFRMLQPLVVVMMIGVAAWQFMRASNKNSLMRSRQMDPGDLYRSGFGSSGLEGLGPSDLGQMGMSAGLFGSGGLPGLDREFGDYAGPRSSRRNNRMNDNLANMGYGGLNAANARRRARQIMQGRGERELEGVGIPRGVGQNSAGASRQQGLAARQQQQRGVREAGRQPQEQGPAAGCQQGVLPLQGVRASSRQSPAVGVDASARRVRFEENNAVDSGADDVDKMHASTAPGSGLSSTDHGLEDVSDSSVLIAERQVASD